MATFIKRPLKRGTTWRAVIRLGGYKPVTRVFKSLPAARAWAAKTERDLREGRDAPELPARRKTVADLFAAYREHRLPEIAESQRPQRRRHLDWWEARLGAETKLAAVTPHLLSEVRRELLAGAPRTRAKGEGRRRKQRKHRPRKRGAQRTGATVNRYLTSLSAAFAFANRELLWPVGNPARKVARSKEPRGRVRWLEPAELVALLEAADADPEPRLGPLVRLALATGARQGELMRLEWGHVDLDRRRVLLPRTKSGHARGVPLTAPALEVLRSLPGPLRGGRVFDRAFPRRAWNRSVARAKLEDFTFHDLRHCCAVYMVDHGATDLQIAEVLGHRTLQMVKRYAHVREGAARAALEGVARALEAAGE